LVVCVLNVLEKVFLKKLEHKDLVRAPLQMLLHANDVVFVTRVFFHQQC
jgi:hypothetical protein